MSNRLKTLRPTELIKALEKAGFEKKRQTGSHVIMVKPGQRAIPIPVHPKALKRSLQEAIIKQAGFTLEEFSKFL
jgi:predicted RNA binding protein YcfA (HicA-like mRNA interferase family)